MGMVPRMRHHTLVLVLSLVACSASKDTPAPATPTPTATATPTVKETPAPAPAPVEAAPVVSNTAPAPDPKDMLPSIVGRWRSQATKDSDKAKTELTFNADGSFSGLWLPVHDGGCEYTGTVELAMAKDDADAREMTLVIGKDDSCQSGNRKVSYVAKLDKKQLTLAPTKGMTLRMTRLD